MSEQGTTKILIGFATGLVAGAAGLFFAQSLTGGGETSDGGVGGSDKDKQIETLEAQLSAALQRSAELEREKALAAAEPADAGGAGTAGTVAEVAGEEPGPEPEAEGGNALMKAMMEMGVQGQRKKIDATVAELAERLDLTEAQQEEVRAALLAKLEAQQQAGLLLFSGKATIADLMAADEDNYTSVDAAMVDILSGTQLEEYESYMGEREVARIEKKANQEISGLKGVADLTEEQESQAWDAFAEINAGEPPGGISPDTTPEEFNVIVDEAIEKRVAAMQPILTEPQLESYRGQTDAFRNMVKALVKGGTDGGGE